MPATTAKIEITFVKERDTKNTIRYQELVDETSAPVIGTLYVAKWAAQGRDQLTVTIE